MPRETKELLKNQISTLTAERDALKVKTSELTAALENERGQKEKEFNEQRDILNQEIARRDTEIKDKQKQIDVRELKKFAEAYGEQETQYRKDAEKWFKYVFIAFVVVIIGTVVIVHNTQDVTWGKRIGYYLVDIVLITFLVFSLKQYSYYVKLSTDYGNRKTLAQSYHNIINSTEDVAIKNKFLDKASDVLTSKAEIEDESYTIPEKILESMTEIGKNLSKPK